MRSQPSQVGECTTTRLPCTWRALARRGPLGARCRRSASQRAMTVPTGSSLAVPKLPAARVVVNARTPNWAKSSIGSSACSRKTGSWTSAPCTPLLDPRDVGAECVEALVDPLVAALDLADVIDRALAAGAERGEEHRHARTDVRGLDGRAAELRGPGDDRAVRVAEHYPRAHADQLVHEEHSRLEHLLVHEDHPLALRRGHDRDRHHVGRERRPGLVLELRHVATEVALDDHLLILRHDQVVARGLAANAHPLEAHQHRAEVLDAGGLDAQLGARDGGESDEG